MAPFVAADTVISVDEPVFIHNAFRKAPLPAQTSQIPKNAHGTFQPYCPGEMLALSAVEPSLFDKQFGNASLGTDIVIAGVANDRKYSSGSESECSTTDTTDEANSPMRMAAADGPAEAMSPMRMPVADGPAWMPNMAMLGEGNWPTYAPPGYWMQQMQYPTAPPAQAEQAWSQTWLPPLPPAQTADSAGSALHRQGRCKPCAFMYKDGCRSGAECPYCHLCPPGEKQRRKRVMRSMQRNTGSA